ncbi:MAG: nitrite/sulfite reductase [Acidobacteriota bacterium]
MRDIVSSGGVAERETFEARYEQTVREEIERFRSTAAAFLAGQVPEDEFRSYRLRHGIYGQRQPGFQMIRCKIPSGLLTAEQLGQLAAIADEFAGGRAHLTTRQNIQFHFVPLAVVADVMHTLADVRLTTREACFNTVRNVTACPLSGLARDEVFDVRPYAQMVAFAFLRQPLTDSLPRKFKIAFSGCAEDCTRAAIHDIGLRAVMRGENGSGQRGFRMVVGGGLGPLPVEAHLLDEFVPEERLLNKCEAVLRVFNEYGNRRDKNKARMKFVLRERGLEWFREAVEREYQDILRRGGIEAPEAVPEGFGGYESRPRALGAGLVVLGENGGGDAQYARWVETNVREQQQPGYALVTARIDQGNLTGAQMHLLARLAAEAGDGLLRTTTDQNLVLAYVPRLRLRALWTELKRAGLGGAEAHNIEDVTTCPGAYTCNLGLTKSMNLGAVLQEVAREYDDAEVRRLKIKISGCPNACGQHWIADIGFYGNARKHEGRELPYYQMLLGGGDDELGRLRFGLTVQSIAARLAPAAVRRVLDHFLAQRQPGESFRQYVLRFKVEFFRELTRDLALPVEYSPEMFRDWGDEADFSLKLGRGECAA